MQEPVLITDFSPYCYFKKSLELMRSHHLKDALQAIDTAIIFSSNSPFYIYQKVKLLFHFNALEACSHFILLQLQYFFRDASLYLVCRLIDYYQKINALDTLALAKLLEAHHVPSCLAQEYTILLKNPNHNFLPALNKVMFQDRYKLCIDYCELILKTKNPPHEILFLKGYAYHMLRELIKARVCYSEYIALEPKDTMAHDYLGFIFMEEGLYTDALKAFETALTLMPNNKDYMMHLAECYYVCREYEKSAQLYDLLNEKYPNDLQITFYQACLYKKFKKKYLHYKSIKKLQQQAIAYL